MEIMTFNTQHCMNYITGKIDFEIMADAILRCGADVVGLNEMRGLGSGEDFDAQVERLAALTEMKYFYFAQAITCKGGPYGNGLLSRVPILRAETVLIPDPLEKAYTGYYETRCILRAELEGGLTVLVTHMGLNPDERDNAVCAVMERLSPEKCILMGDFNMRPDDSQLKPIKDHMTDAAERFDSIKLSFPSDIPQTKIDYIFVSSDIEVLAADIPPIVASDHRPHTAWIRF